MARNTYLLIHGAWHGGWCWRSVATILRAQGHEVFTPTLTGCGERSHLLSSDTDLESNIQDVLAVISYEDLRDIVLCGHSYAGMVITAVADRVPERLRSLVYLEAYVPEDGQSVLELRPDEDNHILLPRVEVEGDGWRMPPKSAEDFRVQRAEDRLWVNSHLSETALKCFSQPIRLTNEMPNSISKTYVRAGDFPNERFEQYYRAAVSDNGWSTHFVEASGHDLMVDQPEEVARILRDI